MSPCGRLAPPQGFTRRLLTLPPGGSHAYAPADWVDAIVLVATGSVEVEGPGGARTSFRRGDLLWLAGLPVRALHNRDAQPAVLLAVRRAGPNGVDHVGQA